MKLYVNGNNNFSQATPLFVQFAKSVNESGCEIWMPVRTSVHTSLQRLLLNAEQSGRVKYVLSK